MAFINAVTMLRALAVIASIVAVASPWKKEACSETSVSLYNAGYDNFIPLQSESVARGYVTLALFLFSLPTWQRPSRVSLVIIAVAWFMLNEGVIEVAKTRCPGGIQRRTEIYSGIFAAYTAAVFSVWSHASA
tara:strand:- start:6685 stop:7083 length:399 start_codon:yes stop_codon:yes gene_type:complete